MTDMSWANNPALKDINPRKMEIITELVKETEGKPATLSMPALMKANNTLKQEGMAFTQEESTLIMDILTKNMTSEEKVKLENLKKMLKNYKGKL